MKWVRLMGWVVIRGVVSGAVEGAIFGTMIALLVGTLYGGFFGALLGLVLGVLNGVSLAVMTRVFFYRARNLDHYWVCVLMLAIPINVVVVGAYSMSMTGILGVVAALMAGVTTYYFSFGYVEYADAQLRQESFGDKVAAILVIRRSEHVQSRE